MGGAFTAVADDASGIYWNPAGLAAGAIVSVLVDVGQGEASPDLLDRGRNRSSFMLGLTTPALGLGYYRLRHTQVDPGIRLLPQTPALPGVLSVVAQHRVDTLVTHHAGVTIVQSLTEGVAVGSTLKFVRGIAGSQDIFGADLEQALETGTDLIGRASNKFDLDIGLMAYGGPLKAGLTLRNVREPEFETPGDDPRVLTLEREVRAGISYEVTDRWLAAVDLDLVKTTDVFGERREAAFGVEGQVARQVWVRSGFRFNTADDGGFEDRRQAAYSIGGSYAARAGLLIDGHFSAGEGRAGRQWGIGARFVY